MPKPVSRRRRGRWDARGAPFPPRHLGGAWGASEGNRVLLSTAEGRREGSGPARARGLVLLWNSGGRRRLRCFALSGLSVCGARAPPRPAAPRPSRVWSFVKKKKKKVRSAGKVCSNATWKFLNNKSCLNARRVRWLPTTPVSSESLHGSEPNAPQIFLGGLMGPAAWEPPSFRRAAALQPVSPQAWEGVRWSPGNSLAAAGFLSLKEVESWT